VQTYFFLGKRSAWRHVAGSSGIFISTANAALIAILTALMASGLGAGATLAAVIGVVVGLAYFAGSSVYGYRSYVEMWRRFTPVSPTSG
jgi:fatty acid desaturase